MLNWFTGVKVKSPKLFALVCLSGDVPYQMNCKCQCSLFLYEVHFQGLCDRGERPDKRQRALKRQTFRSSQKNCQKLATRAELKAKWSRAFGLSCYRPTCTQYRQRGVMWQSTDQIFFSLNTYLKMFCYVNLNLTLSSPEGGSFNPNLCQAWLPETK